jgi:hypothetical protein
MMSRHAREINRLDRGCLALRPGFALMVLRSNRDAARMSPNTSRFTSQLKACGERFLMYRICWTCCDIDGASGTWASYNSIP